MDQQPSRAQIASAEDAVHCGVTGQNRGDWAHLHEGAVEPQLVAHLAQYLHRVRACGAGL